MCKGDIVPNKIKPNAIDAAPEEYPLFLLIRSQSQTLPDFAEQLPGVRTSGANHWRGLGYFYN
jgi:hypothetical protein